MARSPLPYVAEPAFKGLGVFGEAQAQAEASILPARQEIQNLEAKSQAIQVDEKQKLEAQQFQKLLQQGVNGMQAYVQEVNTKYPELGQRFTTQLQSIAPLFKDPQMKREKAWEISKNIYDSWNEQIKEADKLSAEAKAKAEMEGMFTDWDTKSKAKQQELGFKLKPEHINEILGMAPPKLQGYEPFQKAADNLKKQHEASPLAQGNAARADKAQVISLENSLRDEFNTKIKSAEAGATAFRKLSQALERNNPADAYSAIINYVRTLDPGSTVREAEERLARERASGGPLGALGQHIENLKSGVLTDPIRKNLFEAGKGLIQAEMEGYKTARADYATRVQDYIADGVNIKESRVLGKDLAAALEIELARDIFKKKEPTKKSSRKEGEAISVESVADFSDEDLEARRQELLKKKKKP